MHRRFAVDGQNENSDGFGVYEMSVERNALVWEYVAGENADADNDRMDGHNRFYSAVGTSQLQFNFA